jgi:hypothetical protein
MAEKKKYRITPAMIEETRKILLEMWRQSGSLKFLALRVQRLARLEEPPNRGFLSAIARGSGRKSIPPGWLVKALGVRYIPAGHRHTYTRWRLKYLAGEIRAILLLFILSERAPQAFADLQLRFEKLSSWEK